jgi:hypothetical protein
MKYAKIAILISFLLIIAFLIFDEVPFKSMYQSNNYISNVNAEISDDINKYNERNNIGTKLTNGINPNSKTRESDLSLNNKHDFSMDEFMILARNVSSEQKRVELEAKVNSVKDIILRKKMKNKLSKINKDFFQLTRAEKSEILNN